MPYFHLKKAINLIKDSKLNNFHFPLNTTANAQARVTIWAGHAATLTTSSNPWTHTHPSTHLQHVISVRIQGRLSQLYYKHTVRATGLSIQLSVCDTPLLLTCSGEHTQSLQKPAVLNRLANRGWQSQRCFQRRSIKDHPSLLNFSSSLRFLPLQNTSKASSVDFTSTSVHPVTYMLWFWSSRRSLDCGGLRDREEIKQNHTETQRSFMLNTSSHANFLLFKYKIQTMSIIHPADGRRKYKYVDTHSAKISYTSATALIQN